MTPRIEVPAQFEIEPGKGAGPFLIGASRNDVERILSRFGEYSTYRPSPDDSTRLFADSPSLTIGLSPRDDRVEYVAFTHSQNAASIREQCPGCRRLVAATSLPCSYVVSLRGMDVFHTTVADLFEGLRQDAFEEYEEDMMWVSRPLQVALWREDPSLPFFQSVTVGGPW